MLTDRKRKIIKVYDIEELYRTLFIVMELVEGESLKDMFHRLKKIPPRVAANFVVQICTGLRHAHERNILHQDINPSNILVQAEDKIKILDFGVACPVGSDDRSIFEGTVHYMAPEQIKCEPVDQRTDIYSLGITAYEIVTGRKPFQGDNIRLIMNMHLNKDIRDPVKIAPKLPEPLRRFIIKACHKNPDQRYQDAGEAIAELLPLISNYSLSSRIQISMDPLQILVDEHGLIRQFLDNLTIAADKLEKDERPPKEFFEKAIEFARSFTDRYHHFKEEHVMFAQLAQKKSGVLDGPIDSLRHQHERGRSFIREISGSLEGYAKGDDIHTTTLLENLAAYIHLLRHHIHQEDHSFFQMAKEEFSENELKGFSELFEKEDEKTGGKAFENGRKLVQEMASLL